MSDQCQNQKPKFKAGIYKDEELSKKIGADVFLAYICFTKEGVVKYIVEDGENEDLAASRRFHQVCMYESDRYDGDDWTNARLHLVGWMKANGRLK